jgi:Uma2 family endonuclease
MAERKIARMSVDEFLDWQLRQDKLYELVDGVPVLPLKMMSGATLRHDRVTINVILQLGNQLKGTGYRPTTSDVAIRIPNGNIRRPDITIECGVAKSDRELTAAEPRIVIEVLSPSTLSFDRFRKLEEYKTVQSLRVVLLIDTEAPQVTVHRRDGQVWGSETLEGLDGVVALPEVGAAVALKDLYDGVEFSP